MTEVTYVSPQKRLCKMLDRLKKAADKAKQTIEVESLKDFVSILTDEAAERVLGDSR